MAEERRAVPAVMMAIKVLCEASEDDVMNSLEEFRVAHRARLSALMAGVAEGLEAYKQHVTQASFDAELLVGAVFGNLPDVSGPPSDAAGSAEHVPVQAAHTWGEPVDDGDQAPVSNEEPAPAEAHSGSQRRSDPLEFVDELPSELDYAQFNPAANRDDGAACAADTGGIFGGRPARPSDGPGAVFGAKPSQLAAPGSLVKSKGKGKGPVQGPTPKQPPSPPSTRTTDAPAAKGSSAAKAKDPAGAKASSQSSEWRGWTGDPRGSAVPVRTEAVIPPWAPLVAEDGLPFSTTPPDYWNLQSACRVRCPRCFTRMCSRHNLRGFRRAHSRHRCPPCTDAEERGTS